MMMVDDEIDWDDNWDFHSFVGCERTSFIDPHLAFVEINILNGRMEPLVE